MTKPGAPMTAQLLTRVGPSGASTSADTSAVRSPDPRRLPTAAPARVGSHASSHRPWVPRRTALGHPVGAVVAALLFVAVVIGAAAAVAPSAAPGLVPVPAPQSSPLDAH